MPAIRMTCSTCKHWIQELPSDLYGGCLKKQKLTSCAITCDEWSIRLTLVVKENKSNERD